LTQILIFSLESVTRHLPAFTGSQS